MVKETLNPAWDQTLVLGPITLFGKPEEFQQDPPLVIVEIFDEDNEHACEFIGRTVARPYVKMTDDDYRWPAGVDYSRFLIGKL